MNNILKPKLKDEIIANLEAKGLDADLSALMKTSDDAYSLILDNLMRHRRKLWEAIMDLNFMAEMFRLMYKNR